MVVALAWLALAALAILLELLARGRPGYCRASELLAPLARRRLGRLGLVCLWGFLGWHLFGRYTIHPI